MSNIEPTLELTPEQIAFFHQNGYLAIEAITTLEEVDMMRDAYDRIFRERAGREEGNQFDLAGTDEEGKEAALPQILNPAKYAPELANTLAEANAVVAVQQLLGAEATASVAHAIFKPARSGAATPWHQDEAYWNPELEYTSLSIWMPLQEATIENGCMQFIPGSHKMEVVPHQSINNDPRIHGLEVQDGAVDLSAAVACPLPPGGATFHLSRTLHYTAPNRSDVPRRALIMGGSVPPRQRETPRRFPWKDEKQTARQQRADGVRKS